MEARDEECAPGVRLLLASDVRVYRQALERLLHDVAGIEVIASASSAAETIELTLSHNPSVVLLDITMREAYSAARHISRTVRGTRVVALGVPEVESEVITCVEVGIAGYVTRDGSVVDMVEAIQAAVRGEVCCSPKITAFLFKRIATLTSQRAVGNGGLTAREEQIVRLLQQGLSNKMISRTLGIELPTVKNHIHSIFAKLGVHRRAEAVSLLYRQREAEYNGSVRGTGS